jgi:hypothetical protein
MIKINYKICSIGLFFLFIGILFSPSFVANNLSPDGVLEENTVQLIQIFRFIVIALGVLINIIGILFERMDEKISLIASIGILWIIVATILVLSIIRNQGHVVYALDDAYIHMAIAKNFAQHGVWGITQYGFTSSSSSLLYTLLLSQQFPLRL